MNFFRRNFAKNLFSLRNNLLYIIAQSVWEGSFIQPPNPRPPHPVVSLQSAPLNKDLQQSHIYIYISVYIIYILPPCEVC